MKELVDKLEHVSVADAKGLVLLDTCFIFSHLEHKELLPSKFATTSFNAEELVHVTTHHLGKMKRRVRDFLKKSGVVIVDIDVSPGNCSGEKEYVNSVDKELLKHIADPSDAVLIATALRTKSNVLTKDKHHLFTSDLINYLSDRGVKVHKEFREL
jgi:predicted nucleic acid-binding protein|tara:strand:- start:115 stop:582 length:468 start_codon:yes stop_codon:yes gene_type:complete